MPLPNGQINPVNNPITYSVFVQALSIAGFNPPPPGHEVRITDSADIRITDSGDIRITD